MTDLRSLVLCFFFFFNDTATTEIYTLSLHDALPISRGRSSSASRRRGWRCQDCTRPRAPAPPRRRSEEHTSELQSPCNLVCRLLLEKKKAMLQGVQMQRRRSWCRVGQPDVLVAVSLR